MLNSHLLQLPILGLSSENELNSYTSEVFKLVQHILDNRVSLSLLLSMYRAFCFNFFLEQFFHLFPSFSILGHRKKFAVFIFT